MWEVQGVAQRQEPLHPSHLPLGLCMLDLPLIYPWFTYTVLLVCVCLPSPFPVPGLHLSASFSLVSWFVCPSFVLVCPGLRIPTSCSLLVHVSSPSLFLACWFMFVGRLASLLGHMHCRLCACVCWSPLPGHTCWAFVHDCSAFSCARLGSCGFVYPLVGLFLGSLASYLYL